MHIESEIDHNDVTITTFLNNVNVILTVVMVKIENIFASRSLLSV